MLILIARHVLGDVLADALRVAHLAEHATIRTRNTLDGVDGAIRVERDRHRRLAVIVDVLRRDLSAHAELRDDFLIRDEAALAVRDGDAMDIADLDVVKPRREVRRDARRDHAGDVTAERVVRERRRAVRKVADLAVRHETELDERLEPVADAEHEAVAMA